KSVKGTNNRVFLLLLLSRRVKKMLFYLYLYMYCTILSPSPRHVKFLQPPNEDDPQRVKSLRHLYLHSPW
mgnify:CR=1